MMKSEFISYNPATLKEIWRGESADQKTIELTVKKARLAFSAWSRLSLSERLTYLQKFIDLIQSNQQELSNYLMQDSGKVIKESEAEITLMTKKFTLSLEAYQERTGEKFNNHPFGRGVLRHRPHGVIAVFGPYNFPAHIPNGHILPALIAGNTIVWKPSEQTPFISEKIFQLWQKAGLPDGVINLIQGERKTGEILSQADIDGLFFTGSSRVGEILHKNFAGKLDKILALELGGNNPLIVEPNFDIEKAVEIIIQSAFITNGQRCTCARRLMVIDENNFFDKLVKHLTNQTGKLKIGMPDQSESFMSCLINSNPVKTMLEAQNTFAANGAKILLEAKQLDLGENFISPSIVDMSNCASDPDEEIFAPLLKVYRCKDLSEALQKANNTRYGLAAGIISQNPQSYEEFLLTVKSGIANWNTPLTGASGATPFGGVKYSGNHRPSAYYAADYCAYPVASLEMC